MEAGALHPTAAAIPGLGGRSPLLRLQSDEKLIALIRRGQHGAFETLVQRYQSRLLSFCRHMLGSTEDAEDVLQEVFAAAFNAICADERPINARPWLYRIARNRCLNHLRRPVPNGQDSMDIFQRDGGQTTADAVHKREEFRQIVADVQELPETQRTALLLREMDALSYEHIAEAMDTTVPSVKSLLVRARVSLAEAAEARLLSCAEVRLELGQVAEGLAKTTAPARRHLKGCDRCRVFRGELRRTNRALAAIYPIGPMVLIKKLVIAKLGIGATTSSSSGAGIAGGAAAGATSAGGIASAGIGALATKAVAGFAAAALVTGAVETGTSHSDHRRPKSLANVAGASSAPTVLGAVPQPAQGRAAGAQRSAPFALADVAATPAKPKAPRPLKPAKRAAAVQHPAAAPTAASTATTPTTPSQPPPPTSTTTTTTTSTTPTSPPSSPVASTQPRPVPPANEQDGSTVTIGGGSNGGSGSSSQPPSSTGGGSQPSSPPSGSSQPQPASGPQQP